MREDAPSRTALAVAISRADHQTLDRPIFVDPYAARILGARVRAGLAAKAGRRSPFARYVRAAVTSRSRLAEDALAAAVQRGVRQYVVLGAGLDTFALRNPYPGLRVFEVDHPNTQGWKRGLLREEGLAPDVTFVPVDFERQELATQLIAAGLDPSQPTFFSWLGVVHYLEPEAREATLRAAAVLSGATGGVVFDFFRELRRSEWLLRFLIWLRMRRFGATGRAFPRVPRSRGGARAARATGLRQGGRPRPRGGECATLPRQQLARESDHLPRPCNEELTCGTNGKFVETFHK